MLASVRGQAWWAPADWRDPGGDGLGRQAFLRLLVTELKNQNPLDPVDNREFVSQLAQFSALEQMQQVNARLEELVGVQRDMRAQLSELARLLAAGGSAGAAGGGA